MPYFAPARAHTPDFPNREGGKVVMKDEMLPLVAFYVIVNLLVKHSPKGCYHQRLGLAPCKQGRAMRPLEYADFAGNIPYVLGSPAVHPDPPVEYRGSQDFILHIFKKGVEEFFLVFVFQLGGVLISQISFHF